MKIQNLLTFILFSAGIPAFALTCQSSVKSANPAGGYFYTKLQECQQCFMTVIPDGSKDLSAANNYCSQKMNPVEYCVQKDTSGKSQDALRATCTAQYANVTQNQTSMNAAIQAQQQQASGAVAAKAQADQAAALAAQQQQQQQQQAAAAAAQKKAASQSMVKEIAEAGQKVFDSMGSDKKKTKDKDSDASDSSERSASGPSTVEKSQADGNGQQGGAAAAAAGGNGAGAGAGAGTVQANGAAPAVPAPPTIPKDLPPSTLSKDELSAKVDEFKKNNPDPKAQSAANQAEGASQASEKPAPTTEITSGQSKENEALDTLNKAATQGGSSIKASASKCFSGTGMAMDSFAADVKTYKTLRATCVSAAERAEFLCVEGSSPGAQAAHAIMDAAGPILAVISSAQKTCSKTSDFSGLASTVLLMAKGACVVAKTGCDSSCAAVDKKLAALEALKEKVATTFSTENQKCWDSLITPMQADPTMKEAVIALENEVKTATEANTAFKAQAEPTLKAEKNPADLGAVKGLIAKCESKEKDIASMLSNGLSLWLAKKSADDCVDSLANQPPGSGDPSVAQYCEVTANATTDFCKCQLNPQQQGCPGYVAGTINDDGTIVADGTGTSIRPNNGNSSFAGGLKGMDPITGLPVDLSGLNGSASSAGSIDASRAGGSMAGALGNPGGVGGGGGGGAMTPAEMAKAKAAAEDKKNWDFGSFAAGLFGGKVTGGKVNGDKSGGLSAQTAEGIERKLASDKLAAEVTGASGKSNWEKIRESYLSKESTLDYQGK